MFNADKATVKLISHLQIMKLWGKKIGKRVDLRQLLNMS